MTFIFRKKNFFVTQAFSSRKKVLDSIVCLLKSELGGSWTECVRPRACNHCTQVFLYAFVSARISQLRTGALSGIAMQGPNSRTTNKLFLICWIRKATFFDKLIFKKFKMSVRRLWGTVLWRVEYYGKVRLWSQGSSGGAWGPYCPRLLPPLASTKKEKIQTAPPISPRYRDITTVWRNYSDWRLIKEWLSNSIIKSLFSLRKNWWTKKFR